MTAKPKQPQLNIALNDMESHLKTQEAIQRERSEHLFEEAMRKYGYVEARMVVLLLIGAAGAGKTHAKELFLGRPPPNVRQSTALAEEAIRVMSTVRATISGNNETIWERVDLQQLKELIAEALALSHDEACEIDTSTQDYPPEPQPSHHSPPTESPLEIDYTSHEGASNDNVHPSVDNLDSGPSESSSESSASCMPDPDPEPPIIYEELLKLMMSCKGSRKLFEVDWVYLIDSGGQPSFYEILPLFIRIATVVAFVLKLNERLSDKPMLEYYGEGGQPCGGSHSSPRTNEQLLRHCLRSMQSRKSPSQNTAGPKIFAVGTHSDHEHLCPESRSEKNTKLLEMLRMCFPDHKLGFYRTTKPEELIYPVNAKTPSKEDKKVAEQFRREVAKAGGQLVRIPLPWYVLEQYLQQLSFEKKRKILSTGECEDEARKLRMKWEACEAALELLDKLNIFFYRPEYLKGVVFCGSQLWLDKITELVELMYRLLGYPESSIVIRSWLHRLVGQTTSPDQPSGSSPGVSECLGPQWLRFRDYAIVTTEILKKFPRHYVYDEELFTPAKLLKLLTACHVIAPITDGADEYVMPCLLKELTPNELNDRLTLDPLSPAAPLLIQFPDHWVPAGVFTILISYLQNVFQWNLSLSRSRNPTCFYRNCVEFDLPTGRGGSVVLIDSFEYLEVHVIDARRRTCQKACPRIRDDIINAIKQAVRRLHYGALEPKEAFFCSSTTGKCGDGLHPAEVVDEDEWVCSVNRRVCGELTRCQLVWFCQEAEECSNRILDPTNDLPKLMNILSPYAHIADQLGIQLRLGPALIQTLKKQAQNDLTAHLSQILTYWMQRTSPPATVQALVNAISSPPIDNEVLGRQVWQAFQ